MIYTYSFHGNPLSFFGVTVIRRIFGIILVMIMVYSILYYYVAMFFNRHRLLEIVNSLQVIDSILLKLKIDPSRKMSYIQEILILTQICATLLLVFYKNKFNLKKTYETIYFGCSKWLLYITVHPFIRFQKALSYRLKIMKHFLMQWKKSPENKINYNFEILVEVYQRIFSLSRLLNKHYSLRLFNFTLSIFLNVILSFYVICGCLHSVPLLLTYSSLVCANVFLAASVSLSSQATAFQVIFLLILFFFSIRLGL